MYKADKKLIRMFFLAYVLFKTVNRHILGMNRNAVFLMYSKFYETNYNYYMKNLKQLIKKWLN